MQLSRTAAALSRNTHEKPRSAHIVAARHPRCLAPRSRNAVVPVLALSTSPHYPYEHNYGPPQKKPYMTSSKKGTNHQVAELRRKWLAVKQQWALTDNGNPQPQRAAAARCGCGLELVGPLFEVRIAGCAGISCVIKAAWWSYCTQYSVVVVLNPCCVCLTSSPRPVPLFTTPDTAPPSTAHPPHRM